MLDEEEYQNPYATGEPILLALRDFFNRHEHEVVEIEILPPALEPLNTCVLEDGRNLGVSKKGLAAAFLLARRLFFINAEKDGPSPQTANDASKIILLFDPEHLTAANFRKKRILEYRGQSGFKDVVRREIVFLDSILTSPLHRQSKSPTLWYHRTWLLKFAVAELKEEEDVFKFVEEELRAVCKSGERHPKNYYAWQYGRNLIKTLYSSTFGEKSSSEGVQQLLYKCAVEVKTWCCKNASDISGWGFLLFLLRLLEFDSESQERKMEIVEGVVEFATKLEWEGGSLWVFLRTALADPILEEREKIIDQLMDYVSQRKDHEKNAKRALDWVVDNMAKPYVRPAGGDHVRP